MANDFSASILPSAIMSFEQMMGTKISVLSPKTSEKPVTAVAALSNQTARVFPQFSRANDGRYICTSYKVAFIKSNQNTVDSGQALADVPCAIVGAQDADTDTVEYAPNRIFARDINFEAKYCNNAVDFGTVFRQMVMEKMHEIALSINQYIIGQLLVNVQTPVNTATYGTGIVGSAVEYAQADLIDPAKQQSRLSDFMLLANLERLATPYMIHGLNFGTYGIDARFNAANDDQRSQNLALLGSNSYFDWHGFGVSRANIPYTSLLIDPNATVFLLGNSYDVMPVTHKDPLNTTVWSMPLTYVGASGVLETLMYRGADGNMAPVMADIRAQYSCLQGGAGNGMASYDNLKFEISVKAQFATTPNNGTHTGIVRVNAV